MKAKKSVLEEFDKICEDHDRKHPNRKISDAELKKILNL